MSASEIKTPSIEGQNFEKMRKAELVEMVKKLDQRVQDLGSGKREIKHTPRPNVKYRLLSLPPGFSAAPQINQMLIVLRKKTKEVKRDVLSEPEVFAALERAKESGEFVTRQSPVRVFQYYRKNMVDKLKAIEEFTGEQEVAAA